MVISFTSAITQKKLYKILIYLIYSNDAFNASDASYNDACSSEPVSTKPM